MAALLIRVGLRFAEPAIERQFQEDFTRTAIPIAQFAMALAVFTYAIFGFWDMTSASGALLSTRFRFMVACPLLLLFFGCSFIKLIRRFWKGYLLFFAMTASICVYISVVLFDLETDFKINHGNGTLNFELAAIFVGLLPLDLIYVITIEIFIQLLHAHMLLRHSTLQRYPAAFYAFHLNCACTVVCFISYWREIMVRRTYCNRVQTRRETAHVRPPSAVDGADDGMPAQTNPGSAPVEPNVDDGATEPPFRITISYRRSDSGVITGRIFDRLANNYQKGSIFRDIDDIPPGADFRHHVNSVIADSDVVLAIIGPQWLGPSASQDRISHPGDPVRIEMETALRQQKALIPVLVLGAEMPRADQLPERLQDFAYRHALSIDAGLDFDTHVARLIRAIDRLRDEKTPQAGTRADALGAGPDTGRRPRAS
jgi:TIR domain